MRILLLVVLLFISFSSNAENENVLVKSGLEYLKYNDVWKKFYNTNMWVRAEKSVSYSLTREAGEPQEDEQSTTLITEIYIEGTLGVSMFQLEPRGRKALIEAIEKYQKWNLKASKKSVKLEKEISKIPAKDYWNKTGEEWRTYIGGVFTATFFSQTPKIHQLVLTFPNTYNSYNNYIKHRLPAMYLNYSQAAALKSALSDKAIATAFADKKKKDTISAEFN